MRRLRVILCVVIAVGSAVPAPAHEDEQSIIPYRWSNPPKTLESINAEPLSGRASVPLGPEGSEEARASTADGQVLVILPAGTFAAHGSDTSVEVSIRPGDPATHGKAPKGLRYEGNAYTVAAVARPSGDHVEPVRRACGGAAPEPACATIDMRIPKRLAGEEPIDGTFRLFRRVRRDWREVSGNTHGDAGIVATLTSFGTYVVAARPEAAPGDPTALAIGIAAGIVIAGGAALALAGRRGRPRKRSKAAPRRSPTPSRARAR